jgi:glycine dehydrogenase subunit 1
LEEVEEISRICKEKGVLFIVSYNPVSLGILKRPGDYGADIAVAEGQSLGSPLAFGGPYLGLLSCRAEHLRKIPGRLVGQWPM